MSFPQRCKACRRQDKMNFHVPEETWLAVVPSQFRDAVVCLCRLDSFARQKESQFG